MQREKPLFQRKRFLNKQRWIIIYYKKKVQIYNRRAFKFVYVQEKPDNNAERKVSSKIKIGLALGGGSARGFAHIGVLKVLEEAGITIDYLSGTSMGALIGAIYACGANMRMMEKLSRALTRRNWLDFSFPRMGFISGKKIERIIYLLTRRSTFAELKIPLAIVAVDLHSGKKIIIKEGIVASAVRASISIPGYFVPVKRGDMLLVDGGVLDIVPGSVLRSMGAEYIIAVNVNTYRDSCKINNLLDVISRSFEIMVKEVGREKIRDADLVITPDLSGIAPSQFEKAREAILIGEKAATLVENGETIFLASGSTVLEVAKHLHGKKITVLTNSLPVMNEVWADESIEVISTGGILRRSELSFIGHISEKSLEEICADKVFLGTYAIHPASGLTHNYLPEIMTDRAIINVGREVIVVADHTKFNRSASAFLVPLSKINILVTDSITPLKLTEQIENSGVTVIRA